MYIHAFADNSVYMTTTDTTYVAPQKKKAVDISGVLETMMKKGLKDENLDVLQVDSIHTYIHTYMHKYMHE